MEKVPKKVSKLVWLKELTTEEILTSLNSESSIMKSYRTTGDREMEIVCVRPRAASAAPADSF
jgi:hypothetical protein